MFRLFKHKNALEKSRQDPGIENGNTMNFLNSDLWFKNYMSMYFLL